jgi:L-fuconolactonase
MPQPATVARDSVDAPAEAALSRRALLTASAGLVGAGAMSGAALAQAPTGSPAVLPVPAGPPAVLAVQAPVRPDWLARRTEDILEPDLPIIDPHHHLWDRPGYRYLFPELLADVGSGHNIRTTMFEQARSMYRADGPEELKSLGETEFVSGAAAMSASGIYGPTRCIAGIVAFVDLRLGARAKGLLERHIAVSDGRVRGIRNGSTWSDDPILKTFTAGTPQGLLLDKSFREGFAALAALGLTFDAWMFQTS